MNPSHLALLATLVLATTTTAAAEPPPFIEAEPQTSPYDQWDWTFESGYLWQIGSNTHLDYHIIPTQLTLRGPRNFSLIESRHGTLIVRSRISLLAQAIVKGPESYYFGLSGSPSIEWWTPAERTSFYFSIGGGLGFVDSTDVPGGQGQDFTFNWFSALGMRQQFTDDWSYTFGAYFQHNSNRGMTDPNPGIDALGFTLGLTRSF